MNKSVISLLATLAPIFILAGCGDADNRYPGFQKLAVNDGKPGVYLHKKLQRGTEDGIFLKLLLEQGDGKYAIQDFRTDCVKMFQRETGAIFDKSGKVLADFDGDRYAKSFDEDAKMKLIADAACTKIKRVLTSPYNIEKALKFIFGAENLRNNGAQAIWTDTAGKVWKVVPIANLTHEVDGKKRHIILTQRIALNFGGHPECPDCAKPLDMAVFVKSENNDFELEVEGKAIHDGFGGNARYDAQALQIGPSAVAIALRVDTAAAENEARSRYLSSMPQSIAESGGPAFVDKESRHEYLLFSWAEGKTKLIFATTVMQNNLLSCRQRQEECLNRDTTIEFIDGKNPQYKDMVLVTRESRLPWTDYFGQPPSQLASEEKIRYISFKDGRYGDAPIVLSSGQSHATVRQMIAAAHQPGNDALDQARRILEAAPRPARGNRKSARDLNQKGLEAFQSDRFTEAVQWFRQAHEADASDVEALNNLGLALLKTGDLVAAESNLLTVLAQAPTRATAWSDLGYLYAKRGLIDQAVACYLNTYRYSRNRSITVEHFNRLQSEENDVNVKTAIQRAMIGFSAIDDFGSAGRAKAALHKPQ